MLIGRFGRFARMALQEVSDALDNFCVVTDHVGFGNGHVLHTGRVHSRITAARDRDGADPRNSGPESDIARFNF
jgi:hypothetical protein